TSRMVAAAAEHADRSRTRDVDRLPSLFGARRSARVRDQLGPGTRLLLVRLSLASGSAAILSSPAKRGALARRERGPVVCGADLQRHGSRSTAARSDVSQQP